MAEKKSTATKSKKEAKSSPKAEVVSETMEEVGTKPKAGRIVSYEKLDVDIKDSFDAKYVDGYENFVARYPKPNGEFFYAVPFDTEKEHFLVKVDVKIDLTYDVDEDKAFFGGDDADEVDGADVPNTTDVDEVADTIADDFNDPA